MQWSALTSSSRSSPTYDFPVGMAVVRRARWLRRLPISPTFEGWSSGQDSPSEGEAAPQLGQEDADLSTQV